MTIIEATKSGKRFKRKAQSQWCSWSTISHLYGFYKEDILADDWEIEEKKVEITRKQLHFAHIRAMNSTPNYCRVEFFDLLAKELGL